MRMDDSTPSDLQADSEVLSFLDQVHKNATEAPNSNIRMVQLECQSPFCRNSSSIDNVSCCPSISALPINNDLNEGISMNTYKLAHEHIDEVNIASSLKETNEDSTNELKDHNKCSLVITETNKVNKNDDCSECSNVADVYPEGRSENSQSTDMDYQSNEDPSSKSFGEFFANEVAPIPKQDRSKVEEKFDSFRKSNGIRLQRVSILVDSKSDRVEREEKSSHVIIQSSPTYFHRDMAKQRTSRSSIYNSDAMEARRTRSSRRLDFEGSDMVDPIELESANYFITPIEVACGTVVLPADSEDEDVRKRQKREGDEGQNKERSGLTAEDEKEMCKSMDQIGVNVIGGTKAKADIIFIKYNESMEVEVDGEKQKGDIFEKEGEGRVVEEVQEGEETHRLGLKDAKEGLKGSIKTPELQLMIESAEEKDIPEEEKNKTQDEEKEEVKGGLLMEQTSKEVNEEDQHGVEVEKMDSSIAKALIKVAGELEGIKGPEEATATVSMTPTSDEAPMETNKLLEGDMSVTPNHTEQFSIKVLGSPKCDSIKTLPFSTSNLFDSSSPISPLPFRKPAVYNSQFKSPLQHQLRIGLRSPKTILRSPIYPSKMSGDSTASPQRRSSIINALHEMDLSIPSKIIQSAPNADDEVSITSAGENKRNADSNNYNAYSLSKYNSSTFATIEDAYTVDSSINESSISNHNHESEFMSSSENNTSDDDDDMEEDETIESDYESTSLSSDENGDRTRHQIRRCAGQEDCLMEGNLETDRQGNSVQALVMTRKNDYSKSKGNSCRARKGDRDSGSANVDDDNSSSELDPDAEEVVRLLDPENVLDSEELAWRKKRLQDWYAERKADMAAKERERRQEQKKQRLEARRDARKKQKKLLKKNQARNAKSEELEKRNKLNGLGNLAKTKDEGEGEVDGNEAACKDPTYSDANASKASTPVSFNAFKHLPTSSISPISSVSTKIMSPHGKTFIKHQSFIGPQFSPIALKPATASTEKTGSNSDHTAIYIDGDNVIETASMTPQSEARSKPEFEGNENKTREGVEPGLRYKNVMIGKITQNVKRPFVTPIKSALLSTPNSGMRKFEAADQPLLKE